MPQSPTSLRIALQNAIRQLAGKSPTARVDAEVLAMHVCGLSRGALLARADSLLSEAHRETIQQLVARRATGEPIAYLTGTREFWSLTLDITPAVLIPRPETELLVERALTHVPGDELCTVADLGTGSGAVALAIAHERPTCRVTAVDLSSEALNIARSNARRHQIGNVDFALGHWFDPIADRRFEMIVSNPPYVRADDHHLQDGDVRFEPALALVAGVDGLDAIRDIIADARSHLKPGGWLALEHGHDQADAVAAIFSQWNFREIKCYTDVAGRPRVTEGRAVVIT